MKRLIVMFMTTMLMLPTVVLANTMPSNAETFFPDYTGNTEGYYEVFADQEIQNIFGNEQLIDFIPRLVGQWLLTVGENTYHIFEMDGILYGMKNEKDDFIDWLYDFVKGFDLNEAIGVRIQ